MIPAKSRLLGGVCGHQEECDDGETSLTGLQIQKDRGLGVETPPEQLGYCHGLTAVCATGFKPDKVY